MTQIIHQTLEKRFWDKIDKSAGTDGCWIWTASTSSDGYGQFKVAGKVVRSHRLVFELVREQIPSDMHILHKCDVRKCCNPLHLFLGTHADNMNDKVAKGRQPKGEKVGGVKLTDNKVREILALASTALSQRKIAKRFGVGQSTISRILRSENWSSITGIRSVVRKPITSATTPTQESTERIA